MMKEQSYLTSKYKGKKVFLTGHTGFKGAWMLYWLHILGAEVKGYALAPEDDNALYNSIKGDTLCHSVIDDIRNQQRVEQELLAFEPDFVFHLAAQPLVRLSYSIPAYTFEVNAIGTAYVLDAINKLKKPCVGVMITTDKVYDNKEWVYPYRENEALGGYDPYSASKACAELVINSYRNSFFNINDYSKHKKSIASARAGNVIGGGDWAQDRIIPDIIRALRDEKSVVVRNPNAVRPWQHVLEPISGYLTLGVKLNEWPIKFSDAWNFGPYAEDNKNVEEVVTTAISIWGKGNYEKSNISGQPHEAGLLKLDINKALAELEWQPKWNSQEAISKSINWYKNFIAGVNARTLVEQDIDSYSEKI